MKSDTSHSDHRVGHRERMRQRFREHELTSFQDYEALELLLFYVTRRQDMKPVAHQPKAHIHTWLAWQEEPGTPMGLAITKRYLNADAPYVQQLMDWISRLFDI